MTHPQPSQTTPPQSALPVIPPQDAALATPPTRPLRPYSRRLWEPVTVGAMFVGFFMLLQPFFLALYSASFGVILFGVLGLVVASKLPE